MQYGRWIKYYINNNEMYLLFYVFLVSEGSSSKSPGIPRQKYDINRVIGHMPYTCMCMCVCVHMYLTMSGQLFPLLVWNTLKCYDIYYITSIFSSQSTTEFCYFFKTCYTSNSTDAK